MSYKVFISSTSKDLGEHRQAVADVLFQEGFFPVNMENFTASPKTPLDVSLKEVAESHLFIGIYARRYGFVPAGSEISITEHELNEAKAWKLNLFLFTLDDSHPWPEDADHVDTGERARQLEELKQRVRDELTVTVKTFTAPDDLAGKVKAALRKWRQEQWERTELTPERRKILDLSENLERRAAKDLKKASPRASLYPLQLEERPGLVASRGELAARVYDIAPVSTGKPVPDLFEEHDGRLLVLGKAGAGKTVALLQLTRWLGGLARRDPERPVPVLLTLISWKAGDRLDDWVSRNISEISGDRATATAWVDEGKVVPLLDGLDGIQEKHWEACIAAINQFLDEKPGRRLVVSCRTSVASRMKRLKLQLRLHGAVELCPLDPERLAGRLETTSAGTESLRDALARDSELRELARTPLLFTLMQEVFRTSGAAGLAAEPGTPLEVRKRQVVERFAEQLLKPRTEPNSNPDPYPYTVRQARLALAWLACCLEKHGSRYFLIEELQPTWLARPGQVWAYAVLSRAAGGALLALPWVLLFSLVLKWAPAPLLLLLGVAAGAFAGCLDALRLGRAMSGKALRWRTAHAVAIGTGALLLFGLIGAAWLAAHGEDPSKGLRDGLVYGPPFGLLVGLVFGLRIGWRNGGGAAAAADIGLAEPLTWRGWSRRGALTGAVLGATFPLYLLFTPFAALGWVLSGLFGLVLAALGGRIGGYLKEPPPVPPRRRKKRTRLRLALRSAGTAAARAAAVGSTLLVLGLTGAAVLSWWLTHQSLTIADFLRPVTLAAAICFLIALWLKGLDLVQHATLRLLLSATSPMPRRWIRLLRHAADLNLLRERGGVYQFFHSEGQEYFASVAGAGHRNGFPVIPGRGNEPGVGPLSEPR